MVNNFIFSSNHIVLMLIFTVFLYLCPKLTKNLLPYSYIVEKIICGLIILEIVFEQVSILSMGEYDILFLPISINRFAAYMCIAILFFKKYHLFNIFFSWSLVCSIGGIILFEHIPYRYPNILYFLSLFSKCLLIYANVYLVEVRKFKLNKDAIKENIFMCLAYFSLIYAINLITSSHYYYGFSSNNPKSIILFMIITTLVYLITSFLNKENYT